ncbi:uncharacterized protein PHA67_017001 isoform 2-T6 [Liasis olivaceus]
MNDTRTALHSQVNGNRIPVHLLCNSHANYAKQRSCAAAPFCLNGQCRGREAHPRNWLCHSGQVHSQVSAGQTSRNFFHLQSVKERMRGYLGTGSRREQVMLGQPEERRTFSPTTWKKFLRLYFQAGGILFFAPGSV